MKTYQWRACPVALGLIAALWPQTGLSESYFNPAFLSDDSAGVADLSRFEKGHQQAPGVYRVDIWRNDEFIGTQDVRFEKATGNPPPVAGGLSACVTRAMLDRFGVNIAAFPELADVQGDACAPLTTALPAAKSFLTLPLCVLTSACRRWRCKTAYGATFPLNSGMTGSPPRCSTTVLPATGAATTTAII
jgi:outer membrane usher protein